MMTNQSMVPYAHSRVKRHLHNFNRLRDGVLGGNVDEGALGELEWLSPIFQEIDYGVYRGSG
jgi:predicted glycosyl hydrolase (DUF1957 family)